MRTCRILCACAVAAQLLLAAPRASGEDSIAMPTMPSMPGISAPAIGSGFYTPGASGFYSGARGSTQHAQGTQQSAASTSADAGTAAKSAAVQPGTGAGADSAAQHTALAAAQGRPAGLLGNSVLTAGDLSSLDSLGVLGNMTALLSGGAQGASGSGAVGSDAANSALLEQILKELSDLKERVAARQESARPASFTAVEARSPKILRFLVNGQDILPSVKDVYFSKEEADGTFLLTGDRTYTAGGAAHSETFYLLFKAAGTDGGAMSYGVTASVSQDAAGAPSLLGTLAARGGTTATRTGNLVSLRVDDGSFRADVLLGLDN